MGNEVDLGVLTVKRMNTLTYHHSSTNTSGGWVGINLPLKRDVVRVAHQRKSYMKTWSCSLSANFPSVHRLPVIYVRLV